MNRDFRIGNRPQRPKTLDLRRKVLLKNFFRTQNIFVHSATPATGDSSDFPEQNSDDINEMINVNSEIDSLDDELVVASMEMEHRDDESSLTKDDESTTADHSKQNVAAFSFTTMMVALPDGVSSDESESLVTGNNCASASSSAAPAAERATPNSQVKVKRKFSLKKPYSFSRRKTKEIPKVSSAVKISKNKASAVSIQSPKTKMKRTSLRAKFSEIFTSKSASYSTHDKLPSVSKTGVDQNSSLFQTKCTTFIDLSAKQSLADANKSVSVQTDVSHSADAGSERENKRLRLENKELKSKLQFLLSLNRRDGREGRADDDSNGRVNATDNSRGRKRFESNQENKNGFNPNYRLTRSRSVQGSSRVSTSQEQRKTGHCRRARSVCVPREEAPERNNFYNYRSSTHQPFKPMQSFFYNDGQRKRKTSPTSSGEQLVDSTYPYRKRPRSLSASYDTPV